MSDGEIEHIDLDNFDDSRFANSRYVLTSPRSLEACARLGIKPVELLPKGKEEFFEQYKNFGVKKLDLMFSHYEDTRRDKLLKVRMERIRLMKSAEGGQHTDITTNHDEKLTDFKGTLKSTVSSLRIKQKCRTSEPEIFPFQYSDILDKLPPKDAKRIRIAHQRCINNCVRATPPSAERNLFVIGSSTRPQSSAARLSDNRKSNLPNAPKGDNAVLRSASQCSLLKESDYWTRRHAQDSSRNQEIDQLKQSLEEKEKKMEQNREGHLKERQRQILNSHVERERRLRQAQERRRELEALLENYRKELQETQEQTLQRARERALIRQSREQQRLVEERRQREVQAKENYKQVQQREEEWRKMAKNIQKQKQENIQRFLEEREAKIQESRNLALQAERLREEMLRAYDLDSFDKKVQKVTLINELGLGGAS